jgi:NAD(P)-dependent dehydrogenase (short-subunit alcohol dehydrogenase family)
MTNEMAGKVCLLTGATAGIGAVTARVLAERGATLFAVGRNPQKCAALVQELRQRTGNSAAEFFIADLSKQSDIRALARQVLDRCPRIDVLINNAGAIFFQRRLSADGIEMTFALNHLGYFLLTDLLLDRLKASAPARIVNVASAAHSRATLDFGDLQNERRYRGFRTYCRSKLANVLFTYELARRLAGSGVTANALHPGIVATRFAADGGWRGSALRLAVSVLGVSPEKGARTMIYLATSPDVQGVSGKYFAKEQAVASAPASHDEAAARRLWEISERLVQKTETPTDRR